MPLGRKDTDLPSRQHDTVHCELACSPHTGAIPLPAPVYQAEVNCENIMTGASAIP